jgi:glycerol-3-phosphate dehydrogenase
VAWIFRYTALGRSCYFPGIRSGYFSLGMINSETTPSEQTLFDVVVIGGGINGTGIARDAAGRGLSVLLCEQDDLGRYTSSSSTKLIHGGLRYLEHYDFKLVRHSLKEREVLLTSAPHIIWPLRFVLPHHRSLRPRWMIRLGLFLYDHLGKRNILPASNSVNLRTHAAGKVLKKEFLHGFEYSDCWVQDARIVVLNALDARERGAIIWTRSKCLSLQRNNDDWTATVALQPGGEQRQVRARCIVNAAGPWVENVAGMDKPSQSAHGVRLVKGSHIIVRSLFAHPYAYIFQNSDNRILFAIPYEGEYTLLGTTDVEIDSDPAEAVVSEDEVSYICENANQYFAASISPNDVVSRYVGVRPLFDDASENASEATRDYVLHMNDRGPPVLSVYGGKLTTYRKLSEQVVSMVSRALANYREPWTSGGILPGGDIANRNFEDFQQTCVETYPWCDPLVIKLLARNYGTRIKLVLENVESMEQMGVHFGANLYQVEVEYLIKHEWAISADDIVDRRTRAGLHGGQQLRDHLAKWLYANADGPR